ncbi:hypothetical protein [Escherichia coli]|nr:hypothetical protein [Escherichia coli]
MIIKTSKMSARKRN